jgi:hypothetical protein
MNDYIVKQKDIEILMQSDKVLYYKLELLNEDLKVLDCIEGNLISDNISISSDSDVRRTYNCELIVTDSTFDIGYDKRIWFNKRIRPYIGILHQRSQEIVYYLLGTFLFTDANYNYDATTHTLSLTCNDMMCLFNGIRSGNLSLYKRTILEGTDARTVIIDLLNEIGITKYFIEFNINNNIVNTFQIPYDMVYNAGMTTYQIIKDIVDLYPGTEMYFSKEGIFMIDKIPTGYNEQVVLNDEIIKPILISEQLNTSFKDIYNHIEIWGKINEPDYYSKEVTSSNNVYYSTIVTTKLNEDDNSYVDVYYDEYSNFDVFALRIPETNKENQQININSFGEIPIHNDKGESLPANYLDENTDCIFRYRKDSNDLLYIGQYQCHAECYLTNNTNDISENAVINTDSEFTIEKIGHKLKVLSGGDYDKIYTNSLCLQRCKYELYNMTNKQENLTINTIAIPWLDVNQLIEYTLNSNNKKGSYIINNISCNYADFTMNISANRYYPNYI